MAQFSCRLRHRRWKVVVGDNLGPISSPTGQLDCRQSANGVDAGQTRPTGTLQVLRDDKGNVTGLSINGRPATESQFQAYASLATQFSSDRFAFDKLTTNTRGIVLSGLPGQRVLFGLNYGAPLTNYSLEESSSSEISSLQSVAVVRPDLVGSFTVGASTANAQIEFSDVAPIDTDTTNAFANITSIDVRAQIDAELQLSSNGGLNFMKRLRSIVVETAGGGGTADVQLSASADANPVFGDGSGRGYLDALETIRIVGKSGAGEANASMSLSHDGSTNFLKSLRSIYMEANGVYGSADFSLSASSNYWAASDGADLRGDFFMPSLQSITMVSRLDEVSFSVSHSGGRDFMRSLRTINIQAGEYTQVSISASANEYDGQQLLGENFMAGLQSIRIDGITGDSSLSISHSGGAYFMRSLRSIVMTNQAGDVDVSISASANDYSDERLKGDHFMIALESINLRTLDEDASLSISASGGSNFMRSLKTIDISAGDKAALSISASTNYTGALGAQFMRSLERISVKSTSDNTGRYRAEVSLDNEGGDLFMQSLRLIQAESLDGKASVHLNNDDQSGDDDQADVNQPTGNNFLSELKTIEALSFNGISEVFVNNEIGSGALSSLDLIKMGGLYGYLELKGMFSGSANDIVIDATLLSRSEKSLLYAETHEMGFAESSSERSLVILVGGTDIQYNAILELNGWGSLTPNEALFDLFPYEQYNFESMLERNLDDYKGLGPYSVRTAERTTSFGYPNDEFFDDWAGIDIGGGSGAEGWESIGSNGVQDIFRYETLAPGNIIVGGHDFGLDKFDFSQLPDDIITGNVIDATDSGNPVATDILDIERGDILVTQSLFSSEDAIIWLNLVGNKTQGYSDFESWIYVDNGASHNWTSSDFIS